MSLQIAQIPLGSVGSVNITESAGVLTISVAASETQYGLTQSLNLGVSSVALIQAWAAATTNAGLKAALTELAALLAALPA